MSPPPPSQTRQLKTKSSRTNSATPAGTNTRSRRATCWSSPTASSPPNFDATTEEKQALWALVDEARTFLDAKFHPAGYNIGLNVGPAAGQTVMHMHIHVIPRYERDMREPEGGVRGVIPEKQKYR